jgi:hypothetical protein
METYITKAQMLERRKYPYFGVTDYATKEIFIRKDLPKCVQASVLAHEREHLRVGHKGSFWKNEPCAWWAGFKGQPIGFFLGILLSLTPERLRLYWSRLRGNF